MSRSWPPLDGRETNAGRRDVQLADAGCWPPCTEPFADPFAPMLTPPWREAEPDNEPLPEPLPETEREGVECTGLAVAGAVGAAAVLLPVAAGAAAGVVALGASCEMAPSALPVIFMCK